jgi:hypothetical protein
MEIWHPCAGYETHYEVSNLGNVRSIERMVQHPLGGKKIQYGRVLKQGKASNGYLIVSFCVDKVKSNHSVHRLVARAFIPNESNKPQVNHKDGNKHNNHIDNLEWMTVSENGLHAYRVLGITTWNKGKKMKQQAIITDLKARLEILEAK